MSRCASKGSFLRLAAVLIWARQLRTQAEMIGFSTWVSVEMIEMGLVRALAGRAAMAFQTSWRVALLSLPPLQPMIQGMSSKQYSA